MTLASPPIVKLAFGLLRDIELAVSKFPRCHRYGVGEDLRRNAREVLLVANRAWRDKPQQARWVGELVWVRILAPGGDGEGRMAQAVVRSADVLEIGQ